MRIYEPNWKLRGELILKVDKRKPPFLSLHRSSDHVTTSLQRLRQSFRIIVIKGVSVQLFVSTHLHSFRTRCQNLTRRGIHQLFTTDNTPTPLGVTLKGGRRSLLTRTKKRSYLNKKNPYLQDSNSINFLCFYIIQIND